MSDNRSTLALDLPVHGPLVTTIECYINRAVDEVLRTLPDPNTLSADERRGIIARYTSVLEGNFIYWMTATYLSLRSAEARTIVESNLREEVQDNHPGMLRRFATAARALSTDSDRISVEKELQHVRTFVARLSTLQIVVMMGFFEGFIAKFMPYLADLAVRQGSNELEYTDVHGVVDIAHTQGLLRTYAAEVLFCDEHPSAQTLYEGADLLRTLIDRVVSC